MGTQTSFLGVETMASTDGAKRAGKSKLWFSTVSKSSKVCASKVKNETAKKTNENPMISSKVIRKTDDRAEMLDHWDF